MGKFNQRPASKAGQTLSRTERASRPGAKKGQAMIEFALLAPLFFLLIFAVMDFGRLFFVQMNLQNSVQEAGRFASTGSHLPDPNNPGQNLSRVNSIISVATQSALLGAVITNSQVSSLNGGPGSAGGPGDTVTVAITAQVTMMTPFIARFFPGGTYAFTSSASFTNEPFPAGSTK